MPEYRTIFLVPVLALTLAACTRTVETRSTYIRSPEPSAATVVTPAPTATVVTPAPPPATVVTPAPPSMAISPAPSTTVVVPPSSEVRVCPPGTITC